jgi:hypothetical protein
MNKKRFRKAVRKNEETLESPETIGALFKARHYLFSTKAKNREETLYFENKVKNQTGRLRQQHPKGPLAKIDERAKTHRFPSQRRFRFLKESYNQGCLPCFRVSEERLKTAKHHIEFYDGRKVSGWHPSEGTVLPRKRDIKDRIDSALKEILGWDSRGG